MDLRWTRTRQKFTALALASFIAAGAIGMQVARLTGARHFVTPSILLASTSFALLGVASGGLRTAFGRVCLCGLVCCWIGDVVGPGNFLLGLGAFLVGHLFFASAFVVYGVALRKLMWAAIGVSLASGAVAALLWPSIPSSERLHFTAYCVVISVMLVTAGGSKPGLTLAMPAAVIFYVSDVCVARWRYLDSAIDGYVCYILYYTACALFAFNIRYGVRKSAGPGVNDVQKVDGS